MHDDKLNVVAAPGAGKTVLGLEIVRRLNKHVLILSPTLTIKNQWIDRFLTLFVQDAPKPDFISTDIYNLNRFNVATYQGLHFAFSDALIAELKAKKIEVIVLDEAHHLRSAWWKSLTDVIKALDGVKLIALTATPPYDVDKNEWDKYVELCGPVDCEISVPELVATSDLCYHQDYVIFNMLSREEEEIILGIQNKLHSFAESLLTDWGFITALLHIPELTDCARHEEKILENPKYYSSLVIFLHAAGIELDKKIVRLLGGNTSIPQLDMEWMEIMLQGVLFDHAEICEQHIIDNVRKELADIDGIEKRRVLLQGNLGHKRLMASSIGKLDSIEAIAWREYNCLKDDLSMVILTDYIRKDAWGVSDYKKMGVVPIFQKLYNAAACPNLAILTGSLIVVPVALMPFILSNLPECDFDNIQMDGYISVKITDRHKTRLVDIVTQAINEKKINIVIGTVALLGEGWDCPAINSLVMASFVGSFMLSNQMRGRAIRRSKTDNNKVANIWHLASITRHDYKHRLFSALELGDYHTLKRRFQGFVGIGYTENMIQNGLERLEMVDENNLLKDHEDINEKMFAAAKDRGNTRRRWQEILFDFGGEDIKIVNTLSGRKPKDKRLHSFAFRNLQTTLLQLVIAAIICIFIVPLLPMPLAWYGLVLAWFIWRIYRLAGHFNPTKSMKDIGMAVLEALKEHGAIQTPKVRLHVQKSKANIYSTSLQGATIYENNLYIKCVSEVYRRVDNPRYLLMVKAPREASYFNVPSLFANNKTNANIFYRHWQKHVGKSKLVLTRNAQGRSILLNARKGSFDYNERFFERKLLTKRTS